MYDITNEKSFWNVDNWMQELKTKGPPGMVILVVGNKSDLSDDQRKVNQREVIKYAEIQEVE